LFSTKRFVIAYLSIRMFIFPDKLSDAILLKGLDAFLEYNVYVTATTHGENGIMEKSSDMKLFKTEEDSKKRSLTIYYNIK